MTDELELLNNRFGMKHFIFADDIFSANMRSAKGLCREILARNLKIAWYTATRVDRVDNELLDLMEKAGCYGIGYGIESGSEKILKHMNKGVTLEQAKRAIALTKKTNIKAVGLFIVGYIGETRKTFNETIDFIQKTDPPCVATAGSLALFPGTEVYKLLKDKGIISDEFWLGPQPLMTYYAEHDTYNLNEFRELLLARRKITLFSHLKGKCFYYVGLFLKKHLPPSIYQAMKTIKNRLLSPR